MRDRPDVSSISTRTANPLRIQFPQRQKSRLPFVSWEQTLHHDEEEAIAAIAYPLEPTGAIQPLPDQAEPHAALCEAAIHKLLASGVPRAFHLKPEDVVSRCLPPVVTPHPRAHHALTRPFFSWAAEDDAKLFELCGMTFVIEPRYIRHLVEPALCDLRYAQGGDGLEGLDPRLVAWRAWRLFEECEVKAHDLLMDLRSFVWYALQYPIAHESVILGGSVVMNDNERLVFATRKAGGTGWLVDALPIGHSKFHGFAVALMS